MIINKIFKTIILIIFVVNILGCNNDKQKKIETNQPKWEANIATFYNKNGGVLFQNAKKDPKAATKIGYAYSEELKDYKKAIEWYKYSNSIKPLPETSNYACYAYQQLKEYNEAIKWCKNAIELGSKKALFQLATTYYQLKDYKNSLNYFLKASENGNVNALNNLGLVYSKLEDFKESEKWYKKAITNGSLDAYGNLSNLYLDYLNDNIKGAAYAIALIDTKYSKSSVLKVLKNEVNLNNKTIKKGYELQLTSDEFPIKYKGDLGL
jgi:hypothetical protein